MSTLGTSITTEGNEDDLANTNGEQRKVKRWVQEIKFYETKSQQWHEKAKKILRRYKDDRSPREQKVPRFNILWSVIESSRPALFGQNPKPDIERRFRDKDDLGRISSMVLERAITYFINEQFGDMVRQAVSDRLLVGRGTVWARYEPHFKDATEDENEEVADEGEEITDEVESYRGDSSSVYSGERRKSTKADGYSREADEEIDDNASETQEVDNEVICWDYVHWEDFGHCFGRTWDEVPAIWRKVYLTRSELRARFGKEIGDKIVLDYSPHDLKDNKYDEVEKKATIYEIWDKADKTVCWVHKDYREGPLDEQEDPLGLEDFWPTPRPLYATLANDNMIPVPDYQEYQDQANELDEITSRIGAITKCIKVAGVYDKSAAGVERVLAEGVENQLIPVDQWAIFAEKGGMKGVMELLPMQEISAVLEGLYAARDKVKQDFYEISGSADIMRGQSDPDETATAQTIKSQFGTMRLQDKQDQVKRFCRDLVKIGTQIIAKHFSIDTIKQICGVELLTDAEKQSVQQRMQLLQQYSQHQAQMAAMAKQQPQGMQPTQQLPPPQLPPLPTVCAKMDQEDLQEIMENPSWEEVEALLDDDITLSYKIDIETDSTIKFDQEAEKNARIQFLEATGKFLAAAQQNTNPDLAPLMGKLLEFGVRGFRVGKELETAFDIAIHKMEKDAAGPPKPNPEMMKIQGEQQLAQAKMQSEAQLEQQKMQADAQLEQMKSQAEDARLKLQAQVDAQKAQMDSQFEQIKLQSENQLAMAKAKLDSETKIAVAVIQAQTAMKSAAIQSAQDSAEPSEGMPELINAVTTQLTHALGGIATANQGLIKSVTDAMTRPRKVIRDEQGNITQVT